MKISCVSHLKNYSLFINVPLEIYQDFSYFWNKKKIKLTGRKNQPEKNQRARKIRAHTNDMMIWFLFKYIGFVELFEVKNCESKIQNLLWQLFRFLPYKQEIFEIQSRMNEYIDINFKCQLRQLRYFWFFPSSID